MHDFRYALRSLVRTPAFTLAAVATLALGVGFTTAMFAVVDGVLLRPLPFPEPERVVQLRDRNAATGVTDDISWPNFEDLRTSARTIESSALWIPESSAFADGNGVPERVPALRVSPSILVVLRVSPMLGRGFRADESDAGRGAVVLLSHDFWRTRFGANPSIVNSAIRLDGKPYVVIGVLPPALKFPAGDAAIWQPLVLRSYEKEFREKRMFHGLARLAPGATVQTAAAEIGTISRNLARQYAENRDWTTETLAAREGAVADERPLWLLLAAAAVVLILACVNVANLLLARATAMRDDAAVRAALGASRFELAMHALREAAVIAAGGTIGGIAFGAWMVSLVEKFRPAILPTWSRITIDGRVLAASVAVLAIATLLAGVVPAVAASRERMESLRSRGGVGSRGGLLRRVLTATQVALAVVLLVCAMLLIRTLGALQQVHPGFHAEGRVAATLFVPARADDQIQVFSRYLERVRTTPGVVAAGGSTSMPLNPTGIDYATEVFVDGFVSERPPEAGLRAATPGYFRAIGIPILDGRDLAGSDTAKAPKVAVVNEAFARRFAAGRNPIGLKTRVYCDQCDAFTIVGVAGDTRHHALDTPAEPEIFLPYTQAPHGALTIVAQVRGDSAAVARAMRQELLRIDPDLALANIATVDELVFRSVETRRFNARLLAAFSACALLLAAIGLYGSLTFSISQRRRDIAVRLALGAQRSNLWRLVFTEAASPVVIGIAGGIVASIAASRSLKAMMYGVTPSDPVSYLAVLATFGAVVALVTIAGFRRAAATDVRALLSDV